MENSKKVMSSLKNAEKLLKSHLRSLKGGKGIGNQIVPPDKDADCQQCKAGCQTCSPGHA